MLSGAAGPAVSWWSGRGLVAAGVAGALVAVMLVPAQPSAAHERAEAASQVLAWARANAAPAVDPADPAPAASTGTGAAEQAETQVWVTGTVAPEQGGHLSGGSVSVEFSGHDLDEPVEVTVTGLDERSAATAVDGESTVVLASAFDISALTADGERVTSFPDDTGGTEPRRRTSAAEPADTSRLGVSQADDGSVLIGGLPVGRAPHPEAADLDAELDESMAGDEEVGSVPGVRVEVQVDPAALEGIRAGSVRLMTRETDADAWAVVPSYLDADRSVVVGVLDHLSQFVVIGGKDTGDLRPRVVLDPDNDRAFANSPGPRVTEVGYNVELANQVAARLTQVCNADVVVTRTTPVAELGRDVRAGMAAAHEPDLTVTFGFNGNNGTAWGNIGNGGSEVYSRGGALDEQARASVLNVLPAYTGRPASPKSRANLTYSEYAGLPGALIHLETLFLDHNFDRPVIDNGFSFIVDGVFTSLGLQLEAQGFDCSDPDRGGGWPSPPSAAQVSTWMQLGFKNYAAYGGDPVNFATGNLVELEDLFHVTGPGGSDTQVALVYNSQDGRVTRFGTGWTSDLTARAQRFADGSVMVVRGDGASFAFAPDGVGGYTAEANAGATLAEAGGGQLRLTVDDGTRWLFDASHPEGVGDVIERVDASGAVTRYEYGALDGDPMFRPLTGVVLPGDQRIAVTSDARGIVTALTAPDGRTWQLGYDEALDLRTLTLPDGRVRGFDYDDAHRLTVARDAAGDVFLTNVYDDAGRVVSQGDGIGGTRTFSYRVDGVDYTDASGSVWAYEVDARSRVTAVTDPLGRTTRSEYGALDTPTAVIGPDGARTEHTLDAQGRTTSLDAPDGGRTDLVLDDLGRIEQVVEPGAGVGTTVTTSIERDAAGRPTRVQHPGGAVEVTEYDAAGNPVVFVDAVGERWTAQFDQRGNQVSATDPLGRETTFTYDAGNRLTSRTQPSGATWTYAYDTAGRLVRETDPHGGVTTSAYDANDNLTSTTDPTGAQTRQEWDTARRLIASTGPDGGVTRYTYDAEDVLVSRTDATGAVTTSTLDAAHRTTAVTDPNGGVWARSLDAEGRVVAQTDPDGGVSTWEYDQAGRLIVETDPDGVATGYAYGPGGQLVETRDSAGGVTTFTYDDAGRTSAETGPGGTVAYGYDRAGRVVTTTDQAGRTAMVSYDAAGQVVSATDRAGAVTTFEYDVNGNQTAQVDADGVRETWTVDAVGQVTAAGVEGGAIWAYTYDGAGRVLTETDGLGGATTTYVYDPAGHVVQITDPTGAATGFGYDAAGRQTSTTDPTGVVTAYAYDAAGQLVRVVQNATESGTPGVDENVATEYAYTAVGHLARVTGPTGAVTGYEYTAGGRVASETDALGSAWTYAYDDAGRLATESDPDARTTSYTYDDAGRMTTVAYAQRGTDPATVALTYDATGNLVTMTDPSGATGWTYDAEGRQTAQRTVAGTLTTTYSAAGRRTGQTASDQAISTWTYDGAGRLAQQGTAAGTLTYGYDDADRVTTITRTGTDGAPGPQSVLGYDAAGRTTEVRHRVTEVQPVEAPEQGEVTLTCTTCLPGADYLARRTLPGTGTSTSGVWDIAIDQTYTPGGQVASRTRVDAGGRSLVEEFTYDPLGRLSGGTSAEPVPAPDDPAPDDPGRDAPPTRLAYTYDAAGNRTSATVTDPDGTTRTRTAVFDDANRLTRTTESAATAPVEPEVPTLASLGTADAGATRSVTEYRYDGAGNRTSQTTTPAAGTLLSTGADLRRYAYGSDGRLATITDPERTVAITRDGLGRAATTTTSTPFVSHTATATWDGLTEVATTDDVFGTTTYARDATGAVAVQSSARTATTAGTSGVGNNDPTVLPGGVGSGAVWDLTDALGSVIAQAVGDTLTQVASYDPWGVTDLATAGWDADHGYASQTTDLGLGAVLFYARTYDPTTGIFTTQDAWDGLLTRPGTLNAYTYVLADPLSAVDVLGYWPSWLDDAVDWTKDNWRTVAGAAAAVVVVAGVVACAAATAGVCGAAAAGLASAMGGSAALTTVTVGAVAGGGAAAANYAFTGDDGQGHYSWNGGYRTVATGTLAGGATSGVGYGVTAGLRSVASRVTAVHARPNARPAGSRGSQLNVATRGVSSRTFISGRQYSAHSIDRMYGRGIPPSVVEDAIRSGVRGKGSTWATMTYVSTENRVRVVVDRFTRRVVTVMYYSVKKG
jgi:RHS repeat-associated protein